MTEHTHKITQALEAALQMEMEGKQFYQKLAEKSSNPLSRKLLQRLSADEDLHARKVKEVHDVIKDNKGWPDKETKFNHEISLRSVFDEGVEDLDAEPAKPTASDLEALKMAMTMEDKSYSFYRSRNEEAASPAEKAFYQALSAEERVHYLALLDAYDYLLNPQGWFTKKERWGLDGG